MVTEMKNRRGEMQKMGATIREREERYRALSEEYEKMPKNVNRGLYTYRIMDIIKQVRKQKTEIAKVETKLDGKQTMAFSC
jgi:coiled-coil domain-containing protein 22